MVRIVGTLVAFALAAVVPASAKFTLSAPAEPAPGAPQNPINRVVKLLRDMSAEIEAEAKKDQELFESMSCWCEKGDKQKAGAIEAAQGKISQLVSDVEQYSSKSASLELEISNLNKDLATSEASLKKSAEIRKEEAAAFHDEETGLAQAVKQLQGAVVALSGVHGEAFAQQAMDVLVDAVHEHPTALSAPSRLRVYYLLKGHPAHAALRREVDAFLQAPGKFQSHGAASGQIMGILKQMTADFTEQLKKAQAAEARTTSEFNNLRATKQEEVAAMEKALERKKTEYADAKEHLSSTKSDLEDTRAELSEDTKFLMDLKVKCQTMDREWEKRRSTREQEQKAVSEAVVILTSDEARDASIGSFGKNFLQLEQTSSAQNNRAKQAQRVLAQVAAKTGNTQLVLLASRVTLDAFTKVKKAIDDMISTLTQQQKDEVKMKDYCVEAHHQNDKDTAGSERDRDNLQQQIEDLNQEITQFKKDILALKTHITETQESFKRASEDRIAEFREFNKVASNQRTAAGVVRMAVDRLKSFYNKESSLLQRRDIPGKSLAKSAAGFEAETFGAYGSNGGSNKVIVMMEEVIGDAETVLAEASTGEKNAQNAYATFAQDTFASLDEANRNLVRKTEELAAADIERANADADFKSTQTKLEALANAKAAIHQECDYVQKNFDTRQTARAEEMEALREAKAILAGQQ